MNTTQVQIISAAPADHTALVSIWEASVRSTHHFLMEEDITFYKEFIAGGALETLEVYCIKVNAEIRGFLALTGHHLEMLFIAPEHFRKELGTLLLLFAIGKGVNNVEVNEQNQAALQFYQRSGFQVAGRKSLDGFGKPYPILTLKLADPNAQINHPKA